MSGEISLCVLVVDDHAAVCRDIADIVKNFGPEETKRKIDVRVTGSFEGVKDHLRDGFLPEIVFLDNNLEDSGVDGSGLTRVAPFFQAVDATGSLPRPLTICIVTAGDLSSEGEARFADVVRAVALSGNVAKLIRKPYSIDDIVAIVREAGRYD